MVEQVQDSGNSAMGIPIGHEAPPHIQNACRQLAKNFHPKQIPTYGKYAQLCNSSVVLVLGHWPPY